MKKELKKKNDFYVKAVLLIYRLYSFFLFFFHYFSQIIPFHAARDHALIELQSHLTTFHLPSSFSWNVSGLKSNNDIVCYQSAWHESIMYVRV